MTIDKCFGDEDRRVHTPSISTLAAKGPLGPKHPDFRDTQSLILPFDRLCTPDDPQVRQMLAREVAVKGTAQDRVNFLLNEVFVRTPDVVHVLSVVKELLSFAGLFQNPGGMRIIAPSGMGKDALLRFLLRTYPPQPLGPKPRYPLIYVNFRKRLAAGDILRALLDQMHCAYKNYQSVEELEDCLFTAVDTCGTLGVIFNEAGHMVSAAKGAGRIGARVAGEAGDWLKGFIDKLKQAVFFLGIPGWDEVFERDPQLGSRIPHRYELSAFKPDKDFMAVLWALDQAIPMPVPAGLTDRDRAQKLFNVCKGTWRPLIFLLCNAIISATRRGSPRIEDCDLSWAYHLQFGPKDNPFGSPPKQ